MGQLGHQFIERELPGHGADFGPRSGRIGLARNDQQRGLLLFAQPTCEGEPAGERPVFPRRPASRMQCDKLTGYGRRIAGSQGISHLATG